MAENSGIGSDVISLPQGGGAQSGLGETFSPDLFSGTGNFSIPIAVPKGRNGLQPQLTLGYSTGNGNSEYGKGWSLGLPGVTRKTNKGIPVYDDDQDVFILSGTEDLIEIEKTTETVSGVFHINRKFKPRTEGLFARINYHRYSDGRSYWEVKSKDGLTSFYGNPTATDPNTNTIVAAPDNRGDIFAWKLYKTVDVFGNDMRYSYMRTLVEETEHHYDQLYLNKIEYGNFDDHGDTRYLCSVVFEYEDRPDPFSTYRQGFEIRTTKRVLNVKTYTHPSLVDKPEGYDFPDGNRSFDLDDQDPITYTQHNNPDKITQLRRTTPDGNRFDFRHQNDGAGTIVTDDNGDQQGFLNGKYNVFRDYTLGVNDYNEVFRLLDGYVDCTLQLDFELLAGDLQNLTAWDDRIWTAFNDEITNNLSYSAEITNVEEFYYAISGDNGDDYPGTILGWLHSGSNVTSTQLRAALTTAGLSNVSKFISLFKEKIVTPNVTAALTRTDWDYMLVKEYTKTFNITNIGSHSINLDFTRTKATGSIINVTDTGYFLQYDTAFSPTLNLSLNHSSSISKLWIKFDNIVVRQANIQPGSDDTNYMEILGKQYDLIYIDKLLELGERTEEEQPISQSSLLAQVQVSGYYGAEQETMPPIDFRYSSFDPIGKDFTPIQGEQLPANPIGSSTISMVDLNGNGLPDFVEMDGNTIRYWPNLGNGSFGRPKFMKDSPMGLRLDDPDVRFMDADGDGRVDLVVNKPGLQGYFPLQHNGEWDKNSFQRYKNEPSFSTNDPEVLLMDLNGDGATDVLRNGNSFECFFQKEGEGWVDLKRVQKSSLDEFPNVSFTDPRIRTADLTGDGLQDIVYINNGHVAYWPNLGYGNFGRRVNMRNAPKLPYNFNPSRILVGDLDNDGLQDFVYVEDNKITLWVNQNGNSWSEPIEIVGTPSITDVDSVQIVDINGEGVSGLLYGSAAYGAGFNSLFYLDLTAGEKPYLLHEMRNNMGAVTKVEYKPSTHYYLEDEKQPDTRWKTQLPFPTSVVSCVEVIDQVSQGKLTTEYKYHHGYWDGVDREFRGFGRVDQYDTEAFDRYNENGLHGTQQFNSVEKVHYAAPTVTRSWFHLGPVADETLRDWEEVDYENEYWQEKWDATTPQPITITRPNEMVQMLKAVPAKAKRDAFRTLRGSILRTELYALDGTRFEKRPYTVTEAQYGVRLEYEPDESFISKGEQGSGYIFFSFGIGQRTTQWERGKDPMTSISFTGDFDTYGNPQKQLAIAVPRNRDFTQYNATPPKGYSATFSETEFIHRDDASHYLIGRVKQAKAYEVVNDGKDDLFTIYRKVFDGSWSTQNILSHSLNYYDGGTSDGFVGLVLGSLGDYGLLVRSESLVMTSAQVTSAYGTTPDVLNDKASLPGSYPTEFKTLLPDRCGYIYKTGGVYETGYYTESKKSKYDFHDTSTTAIYGNVLSMRDPLEHEASVEYDGYDLLPKTVTDPVGNETEAFYDYRVLQPEKTVDPNDNITEFAYNGLGLLYKTAVMGKESEGDDLDSPTTLLEYDFYNYLINEEPIWVKTTQRQYHKNGPTPEATLGDIDDTIITCEYSDGFGRLLQTRTQAEEVIYGNPTLGDSGLPSTQGQNANCVGIENTDSVNPNVVVNGWTTYNNKGKPVEQYEPFFAKGFDYLDARYANITSQSLWHIVKTYVDENGESALSNETNLCDHVNEKSGRSLNESTCIALLKKLGILHDRLEIDDDYIDFGSRSEYEIGTDDFSISLWANMDVNIDTGGSFISTRKFDGVDTFDGGFLLRANTNQDKLQFLLSDGSGTWINGVGLAQVDLPSKGVWHHIVWVRKGNDASSWKCYIDGVSQTVGYIHNNLSTGDISDNTSLKIGSTVGGHPSSNYYFHGSIRDVRLFSKELSAVDATALSNDENACTSLYPDDLIFHALLNDNNGVTLKDQVYDQTGTLQLSSHTWSRTFNSDLASICSDEAYVRSVMGSGFIGQKMRMFYDPRAQVVRTLNPDNTEQRVVFGTPHDLDKPPVIAGPIGVPGNDGTRDNYTPSPWINYAYDANDLGDQHETPSGGYAAAGLIDPNDVSQGYTSHFATPKSTLIDELGRSIETTDHESTASAEDVVMKYEYDIQGNVLKITDALNRTAFEHKYNLVKQALWTDHIDSGVKTMVLDCMGQPVELKDAKGSQVINSYDNMNRPIRMWAKDNSSQSLTLRGLLIYGDDTTNGPADPKDTNHLGKIYKTYDEAGLIELTNYDFKGNPTSKKQQVIDDTTLLSTFPGSAPYSNVQPYVVDWVGLGSLPSILDATIYETQTNGFDALNRPFEVVYPTDQDSKRKVLVPEYNRGGGLARVHLKDDEGDDFGTATEYVKEIAYNAKGQRLLLALGNGVMTRYAYSELNFRLLRTQTEAYSYAYNSTSGEHTYTYQSGTRKNDVAHLYDLTGNILSIVDQTPAGTAAQGAGNLTRKFSYDPLNRLLSATGRECDVAFNTPPWDDTYSCHDYTNTRNYTRTYAYDKLGNILKTHHDAGGANIFTRIFNPDAGAVPDDYGSQNLLNELKIGASTHSYTYDANGNQTQASTNRFFRWDYGDQLKAFIDQTGTNEPTKFATYIYSRGQRVKKLYRKKVGGSFEYFVTVYIDGVFEHSYKKDNTHTIDANRHYNTISVMEGSSRIASLLVGTDTDDTTPTLKYCLEDHLGSSTVLLDSSGNLVNREECFAFGETSFGGFGKKRYRYNGKEKDDESGLYYYGARYYAPWLARFISVDPMASKTIFQSPFSYANNNPVVLQDHKGMIAGKNGDKEKKGETTGSGDGSQTNNQASTSNTPDVNQTDDEVPKEDYEKREKEDGEGGTYTEYEYENGDKIIDRGKEEHAEGDFDPETRTHTIDGDSDQNEETEYDGDTIEGLARRYNTTKEDIYDSNEGLQKKVEENTLQSGDQIHIPNSKPIGTNTKTGDGNESTETKRTEPKKERKWWQKGLDWVGNTVKKVKPWYDSFTSIWGPALEELKGLGTKAGKWLGKFGKTLGIVGGVLGAGLAIWDMFKHGINGYNIADLLVSGVGILLAAGVIVVSGPFAPLILAGIFVGGIGYGLLRSTVLKAPYE